MTNKEPRQYISRGRFVTTLPHPMIKTIKELAAANRRTIGAQVEVMLEQVMCSEGDMI